MSTDKPTSGRSSLTINDPPEKHPGPDDFAALSDIHETGMGPRYGAPHVWGVAAVAFLLGGAAMLWWSSANKPPGTALAPSSATDALGLVDPRDPANKATIVVSADAPCMLWVGGKPIVRLATGEPAEVAAMPVEQQIICQSLEQPSAKAAQIRKLDARSRVFVNLELAASLTTPEAKAPAGAKGVEASAAAAPASNASSPGYQDRWIASGVDALRDGASGLKWTQDDNGSDIAWNDAGKYCETLNLGGTTGWRLPTTDELKAIYDTNGAAKAPCRVGKCAVSTQFRLSSYLYWSADPNGDAESWSVSLGGGQRASYPKGHSLDARALCVKSA
jgi:hypothetical protein